MWNSAKPEDAGVNFLRSVKKNTYCEGVQPIRALGTKEVVSNIERRGIGNHQTNLLKYHQFQGISRIYQLQRQKMAIVSVPEKIAMMRN